jgi:signal transduction histidine kinase
VLVPGGVTVAYDLEPGVPPVLLDAEQMRQVIINLVDNAMEALGGPAAAARPDGRAPAIVVRTRLDAASSRVQIDVTDNGPGVSPADKDKLFMPYYSTKGRGSGLGLAIVRRIVADQGGVIEALAAEPSGTTFRIELPCLRS